MINSNTYKFYKD